MFGESIDGGGVDECDRNVEVIDVEDITWPRMPELKNSKKEK